MRNLITVMVIVLAPAMALAGGWEDCISGAAKGTVGHRESICFDPASGDLDSDILFVGLCENIDVIYEPDRSGAGVAIDCAIRQCLNSTVDVNACLKIGAADLTGTYPLDALEGVGRSWIYADCTGTIGTETPRVLVKCNP